MIQQEKEFNAWGLNKLAVRNIVVFFILCLIAGISILARVIVAQSEKLEAKEAALIRCKEDGAAKIEQLKNEGMENYVKLQVALQKQSQMHDELLEVQKVIQAVQKKMRK